jgi:lipoate-protein ligase A
MNSTEPEFLASAQAEQEWIARCLEAGLERPRLALVHYERPAVIYGRSTIPAAPALERAREAGCSVLQRHSGGGAVLAGPWMLGAALLVPAASPLAAAGIVGAFRQFGAAWAQALQALGFACHEPGPAEAALQNRLAAELGVNWVCFSGLSHGELVDAAGRKVLGLAQWRGKWGVLLSAGLLLRPVPWDLLGWVHLGSRPWSPGYPTSGGIDVDPRALGTELVRALRATSVTAPGTKV